MYVVGHRGAAGVLPENTLKGFEYAIGLGVDMVECDVHLTFDQQLVVMHDEMVDRTTNGAGPIAQFSLDAIRRLDAGDGQPVPTLDEVLECVDGKVHLLCELKGAGTEAAAVQAVRERNMEGQVTFTCFHMDRLESVRRLGDELQLGAILPDPTPEQIARAVACGARGVGVHYRNLCLRHVAMVHDARLDLRAWNPDTAAEQQAMIGLGVDGVSTNRPDLLMAHVGRSKEN